MSYASSYVAPRRRAPRRGFSDDVTTQNPEQPSFVEQVMANPLIMAIGIGVTTGVIAVARGKQISQRALYITTVVTAIGETALILDEPEDKRPNLWSFAALSAVGVLIGLVPFTSWNPGDKSLIQKAGEGIADRFSPPQPDLVTT